MAGVSTQQVAAYWDDYAHRYDEEPDHGLLDATTRAAWRDLLRTWLPVRPADVVDLACGTGTLTVLAAELGHTVRGFDISSAMVERARAKTVHLGAAVEIDLADVGDPPLAPASVDVVLARHILWTLPEPERALERWVAALRPGGRLVLVEGRWAGVGDDTFADPSRMPWAGGVPSRTLSAALAPLVAQVSVVPLTDPALWGREVEDERYLLAATVGSRP